MNEDYADRLLPPPSSAMVERAQRFFWDYIVWGVLKVADYLRPGWESEMKQGVGDFLRIAFLAVVLAALVMIALPYVATLLRRLFALAVSLASILWSLAIYFAKFLLFLLLVVAFSIGLFVWRAHPSVAFLSNGVRMIGQMIGL